MPSMCCVARIEHKKIVLFCLVSSMQETCAKGERQHQRTATSYGSIPQSLSISRSDVKCTAGRVTEEIPARKHRRPFTVHRMGADTCGLVQESVSLYPRGPAGGNRISRDRSLQTLCLHDAGLASDSHSHAHSHHRMSDLPAGCDATGSRGRTWGVPVDRPPSL